MAMILDLKVFLTLMFLYCSLAFALATGALTLRNLYPIRWTRWREGALLAVVHSGALWCSYVIEGPNALLLCPLVLSIAVLIAAQWLLPNYSLVGRCFFISNVLLLFFGLLWSLWFISTIPVSASTRWLLFAGVPLLVGLLPSAVVQFVEQFEVLCRRKWLRPRRPLPVMPRSHYLKVSLHVPTHAEPPELVMQTLNTISAIDYPNFEVLVIDNNTKNEDLWKPVQAHCERLGHRFRFFHVDPLPGAKAGALNFALTHTAPDAAIIGVIDADYHPQRDFIQALVGYFDDPNIGFVQTPHDYRAWEHNAYLRMCYFEYKTFFHTILVTRNERDAALTVGTMCLIKKEALEKAGGWAEWCVTEDSELAVRIHAVGYSSVYVTQSFGKGLIPETFAGYKRQRYRWTAGPVQEFKHHFNLLMPWPFRTPSRLTFPQQVHHLNHGLDRCSVGSGLLLAPLGVGVVASMVMHHESIGVPFELWVAATVLTVSGVFLNWLLYKVTIRASLRDTIGALIATKALSHVVSIASFRTMLSSKTPWHRTNKFHATSSLLRAVTTTKIELLLALSIFAFVTGAFVLVPLSGLLLLFVIGLSFKGFDYAAAFALAVLAERNIHTRTSLSTSL